MSQPRPRPTSLYASWTCLSRQEKETTPSNSNHSNSNTNTEGIMDAFEFPFAPNAKSRLPRAVSRTPTAPSPSPSLLPGMVSPEIASPAVGPPTQRRIDSRSRYQKSSVRDLRGSLAPIQDNSPTSSTSLARKHDNMNLTETATPRAKPSPFVVPSAKPDSKMKERRFVSTPSKLPSHKKENMAPRGLMRPISPTQANPKAQVKGFGQDHRNESSQPIPLRSQPIGERLSQKTQARARPTLTKSRTVNALSNLRNSFGRSKSTLNLNSSQGSFSSVQSPVIPSEDASESAPEDPGIYFWGSHPNGEWLGRFMAIESRFKGQSFQLAVDDGPEFQKYIHKVQVHSSKNYPELKKAREERKRDFSHSQSTANESNNYLGDIPPEQNDRRKFMADDDKMIAKRAMEHLSTLCKDDSAKKSFLQFLTTYAKVKRVPELLPEKNMIDRLLGKIDAYKNKNFGAEKDD